MSVKFHCLVFFLNLTISKNQYFINLGRHQIAYLNENGQSSLANMIMLINCTQPYVIPNVVMQGRRLSPGRQVCWHQALFIIILHHNAARCYSKGNFLEYDVTHVVNK